MYQRDLGVSTLPASMIFLFYAWYFMTLGHRIAYLIAYKISLCKLEYIYMRVAAAGGESGSASWVFCRPRVSVLLVAWCECMMGSGCLISGILRVTVGIKSYPILHES